MSRQELDKIKLLRREIDRLLKVLRDAQNEPYEPMRRVKIRWARFKLAEARSKLQNEILRRSMYLISTQLKNMYTQNCFYCGGNNHKTDACRYSEIDLGRITRDPGTGKLKKHFNR